MGLVCPECHAPGGTLAITAKIELPPDSRSDEITLQIIRCSKCHFDAIAAYEESRRGGLDDDHYSHTGYSIDAADLKEVRKLIRRCPARGNPRCTCAAHRELGHQDASGRWDGLAEYQLGDGFAIQLWR
jgi:hypothetical protein